MSAIAALGSLPLRDRIALYFRLHPDANINAERAMDFLEHLQLLDFPYWARLISPDWTHRE